MYGLRADRGRWRRRIAWLVLLCLASAPPLAAQESPKMVALVNGAIIYQNELDAALKLFYDPSGEAPDASVAEDPQAVRQKLLENLIDRELLLQEAHRQGLTISTARVLRRIERLPEKLQTRPGQETVTNGDAAAGDDAFFRYVQEGMLIERLLEKELPQIGAVTEKNARAYFDENRSRFIHPEEVHLRHILIQLPPKVSMEERQKAYLRMQALAQQLAEGADFATLAIDASQCPSSARGGDLGYLTREHLYPTLAQAAFALVPGQVSRIVESPAGYHLLLVSDRRPARQLSFLLVREGLQKMLRTEQQQKATRRYIRALREAATIERLLK